MENVLLSPVPFRVTEGRYGTWRRFLGPTGLSYTDFTSRRQVLGLPLINFAVGINPETGNRAVARGIVAIGPRAVGVVAVGRIALGLIAVGQLGIGAVALGQAVAALAAVGQLGVGVLLGVGQVATGYICVAQLGFGHWVLAQLGFREHVWAMRHRDPEAAEYFRELWHTISP